MKPYRLFVLALALALALAGCGTPAGGSAEPAVSPASIAEPATPAPTPEPVPEPAPEPTAEPAAEYDITGLYLQVLEDLWNTDDGLNSGITYISVDLSTAPVQLSGEEVTALAETFAAAHQVMPLTLSYRELIDQGYFTEEEGYWEEGLLFSIKASDGSGETPTDMTFDAEKWRSVLGADFYMDCTPIWSETGACEGFETGGYAIS